MNKWLDAPDSAGWWWLLPDKSGIRRKKDEKLRCYYIHEWELNRYGEYRLKYSGIGRYSKGKWCKAQLPEVS